MTWLLIWLLWIGGELRVVILPMSSASACDTARQGVKSIPVPNVGSVSGTSVEIGPVPAVVFCMAGDPVAVRAEFERKVTP
jgi:hypothetical protein